MANEYVSLVKFKNARGITKDDKDTELQDALTDASRAIDDRLGRRFWLDPAPVTRTFSPRGRVVRDTDGERLLVNDIGDAAGLLIETGTVGGATWTPFTSYATSPDNALADGTAITSLLRPQGCWPVYTGAQIRVTARWGWPAVPAAIQRATLILANRLYMRKDSPEGIAGSTEWGVVRLSRLDPDVEALLAPYTLPGIG